MIVMAGKKAGTPRLDQLQQRLDETGAEYWRIVLSFRRSLRSEGRAANTERVYMYALLNLGDFLTRAGHSLEVHRIKRGDVEDFLISERERVSEHTKQVMSPQSIHNTYQFLTRFFNWWVDDCDDEQLRSPMAKIRPPKVADNPPTVLTQDEVVKLFKATEGQTFAQKRLRAMVVLFIDTGIRRNEMASIKRGDIDWDGSRVQVTGKGSKTRWVPFGRKALAALDRYDRARDKWMEWKRKNVPGYETDAFWVGRKGPIKAGGVSHIFEQFAETTGVNLFPHLFRHTFAHNWLDRGGNESDLEEIAGWTNGTVMLRRYARSARSQRARKAHKTFSPADNLL
jgi:integrase/recombinase XerC